LFKGIGENMSEKQDETRRKNLKNFDSEVQRSRRERQLQTEQNLAEKLKEDGWEILSPTVVCDRIGIKDGRIYFIEFKKKGQVLRAGQQRVHDLMPENYVIVYD
jgi:hypothetical protein